MNPDEVRTGGIIGDKPSVLRGRTEALADFSLLRGFQASAAKEPHRLAVIEGSEAITYGELNALANRWAHLLRSLDVGPGEAVGIAMERGIDLMVAILAVVKAGGVYVPIDPSYPEARITLMLEKVRPRVVLTSRKFRDSLRFSSTTSILCVDEEQPQWSGFSEENGTWKIAADDPLYIIFTSGSTGEPKAAVVQRHGFANLLQWFEKEFSFGAEDRVLLLSSPSFDLTQKNFFAPLRCGGAVVIYPSGPFDLTRLSDIIQRHRVTVMNCTPSAFYPLVEPFDEFAAARLASLRLAVLGGEPISISRTRGWLESGAGRVEIANTYGPTECTDICGFHRLTAENLDAYPFVPIGGTIPNVQVAVFDEALSVVPIGEAGELIVGGVGVGLGYLGDPVRTAERFVANPAPEFLIGPKCYRTGDRVRLLPQGVLEFLGRVDYQVKLRGFRIELPEVEAVLSAHPSVRAAAVVVVNDELVAFHVPEEPATPASSDALRRYLAERLPAHMVPRGIHVLLSFPLTPNGKVDRMKLAHLAPVTSVSSPSVAGTALESQIQAIWSEVLECEVGMEDNFFDLGGDSIQLARVHAKVTALIGHVLPVTDLFAHPSVRALANFLGKTSDDGGNSAIRERAALQRRALAVNRPRPVRS